MAFFTVQTLGCKVNQYDGAALAAALGAAGLRPATEGEGDPAGAATVGLIVVNTCCVTATAMAKSRQALRRALRRAPGAAVLVTGCYADYDGDRLRGLLASLGVAPDRAIVAGHGDDPAGQVRQLALTVLQQGARPSEANRRHPAAGGCGGNEGWMSAGTSLAAGAATADIRTRRREAVKRNRPAAGSLPPISAFPGHQRAFVKVQDGCDAFCAYCVVPYTRPVVAWRPIEVVQAECRGLLRAGHREIVLCGVFLGAYGRATAIRRRWDKAPSLLPQLVRRVGELEGLFRLRLSSLEPLDLTEELLESFRATPTAAWHFHLPLQSGSGRILRRMNRQYTPDDFRRAIGRVRAACPDAAVTTDILVGFPGEGDSDFRATLEVARCAGFSKIHAFPFSPIGGTAAWSYRREAPPPAVVRARMTELAALERELAAAFRRRFVGRTVEALVERPSRAAAPGQALTDRYLTVFFSDAGPRPGEVASFRITDVNDDGLVGR